ncbi:MAG: hypothetical protein D6793_03690, partial [Thermoflexia bacterium]
MVTPPEFLRALLYSLLGALVSVPFAFLPAVHIYNVAGFLLLASAFLGPILAPEDLAMLFLGMVTAYSVLNTIPSVFFSAPDESMVFVVLPGQKYLLQGRGYEAAVLTGIGSLGGIAALLLLTPFAPALFPALKAILQRHLHWILWSVIAFMR